MARTVLMVGTRKGLWIGHARGREPRDLDVGRAALRHAGGPLLHGRHPRRHGPGCWPGPRPAGSGPQVAYSDDLGGSWSHGPDGGIRFPSDTGASVERIWQLQPGIEDDVGLGRHRARRRVALRRPGRDLHPRARAVGPPAPPGVGRRVRRPGHPHAPAAPDRPVSADGGDLDRRRLPAPPTGAAPGRPRNQGIRPSSFPRASSTPSSGSACTRSPGTRRDPERLYAQNHGGVYRSDDEGGAWVLHRRRAAVATSASRSWSTRTTPTPSTSSRSTAPAVATRPRVDARVWRCARRRRLLGPAGRRRPRALPDGFFVGVMRDAMCVDDHDQTGLYLGARDGSVCGIVRRRLLLARAGARHLPDVMVVRAARV